MVNAAALVNPEVTGVLMKLTIKPVQILKVVHHFNIMAEGLRVEQASA